MEEIVIEESNYRAFARAVASLFMLAASVALMIYGLKEMHWYRWVGITGSLIFVITFIISVYDATKEKRLFTITFEGIFGGTGLPGVTFISFHDIMEFEIVTVYRTREIAIIPKDMERFLDKLPPPRRRHMRRSIAWQQYPLVLHVNLAKDMEVEDIMTLLQKRLRDYKSLYR